MCVAKRDVKSLRNNIDRSKKQSMMHEQQGTVLRSIDMTGRHDIGFAARLTAARCKRSYVSDPSNLFAN